MPELHVGEAQDRRSGASFLLANAGGLARRTPVTALLARGEEDRLDAVSFRHVFAQCAPTPDGLVVRMRAEDEHTFHTALQFVPDSQSP
jgi:hypothetical protein